MLRRAGLLDAVADHGGGGAASAVGPPTAVELDGGVSSDIWRVDLAGGPVCVKRARARLKVAGSWEAPIERSDAEAAYLREVAPVVLGHVPRLLAHDAGAHVLVLEWLDPATHPVWKAQLLEGRVDPQVVEMLGRILAAIHAVTAADPTIATRFDHAAQFAALRLDPYLEATARAHPDLAPQLHARRQAVESNRRVLVHGDVSPKNILVGPIGPVLLDAECATYGDAAFDLAFCINHLLLKCAHRPASTNLYLDGVARLSAAYVTGVSWEPADLLEARTAALVPALALARIDGTSPVEYLDETARAGVRGLARTLVASPPARLGELAERWRVGIASWST